jgi:hypothetical protein
VRAGRHIASSACAAVAVACGLAACGGGGGGGTGTFSAPGMAITFQYPGDLKSGTITSLSRHANGAHFSSQKAVAIDHNDVLLVQRYKLKIPTTQANLPELEDAADQVVTGLFKREMTGSRTHFNGIPAITYRLGPSGNGTTSQVSYVFLDGSAYELDCQWEPAHKAAIQRACRQMKQTIKPAS